MEMTIIICAILTTAAIITATVYFVLTMVQVKRTAKEFEGVGKIFNMASPLMNLVFLGGGLFSRATKQLKHFFDKKLKGGK